MDPKDGRSSIHGDAYSDINTISATKYFYDHGFLESYFRPIHNYVPEYEKIPGVIYGPSNVYTHYPALADNLDGAWAKLVHSTDDRILRVLPTLFSLAFFFFIYFFLNYWMQDKQAAFIGASVILLSNYFVGWGDTLYKHTYEEFLKWVFVHGFLYYWFKSQSKILLFGLIVFAAIIANASPEPIVFLSVFCYGVGLAFAKSWKRFLNPAVICIGIGFVAGWGLHIYLNKLYLGSWEKTWQDLWTAFIYRTADCADPSLCGSSFKKIYKIPYIFLNRMERFSLIPGYAFAVFFYLAVKSWKNKNPFEQKIAWIFLAASFAWYFGMTQHAFAHSFVGRQTGILVAWVCGTGILEYYKKWKSDFKNPRTTTLRKTLHIVFLIYIIVMAVTQQIKDIYWNSAISYWFS